MGLRTDGFLLGFDGGSSSIKASLLNAETGNMVASCSSPETELAISAPRPGWAEQDPHLWWEHAVAAACGLKRNAAREFEAVCAIGISYQMHCLVIIDKAGKVLRPSIIWCDSRAVDLGAKAFKGIGEKACLARLLNSPGNFTASKLAWVKENEPQVFSRVNTWLLPGEWLAYRMTEVAATTPSGLSEAVLWDFSKGGVADVVLDWYGIPRDLVPEVRPTFSAQGELTEKAAQELGLKKGVPVSYRAGDQPNNAFSLNVVDPGETATTAGTSGVVYGVASAPASDPLSRVNTFVAPMSYDRMNALAAEAPVGADGLSILPFGNGAEQTMENRTLRRLVRRHRLQPARHPAPAEGGPGGHRFRPALRVRHHEEHGRGGAHGEGRQRQHVPEPPLPRGVLYGNRRAGGAVQHGRGAGRGAGVGARVGARVYRSPREAFVGLTSVMTVEPDPRQAQAYRDAYGRWEQLLSRFEGTS